MADTIEAHTALDLSAVSQLWDADHCPAHLLPWLAWAEGVDEWSSAWSEPVQRAVIRAQRDIRHRRGTRKSVTDAVNALSGAVEIREWWQYAPRRTPHTFDILITGGHGYVEAELQQSMFRAVARNKPTRSHYTLGVGLTTAAQLGVTGVARVGQFRRTSFQG